MRSSTRVAVFGATSAIAEACCRLWAMRGDRLFLAGRRSDALAALVADLGIRGAGTVTSWAGDLADPAAHPAAVAAMRDAIGEPDIVLIAWGSLTDQSRAERDPAHVAAELNRNLAAPAALMLALSGRMAARGTIACITSVAGDRGRQSNFVYGAAKGGLQRFLEGLRHRLDGVGVGVLDIRPGFVATPMTAHLPRSGPLWATADRVAEDIVRAIDRGRAVLYTPWFWRWIMLVVRAVPRVVLHRTQL